jgi:hypothetical protein
MIKIDKSILFAFWGCDNNYLSVSENFYHPLKNIFKQVIKFDPQKYIYSLGKRKMNEKFISLLKSKKPDYAFFWLIYDEFYISTLINMKKYSPNTKFINLFGDDDTLFYNFSNYYSKFFDHNISLQNGFIKNYKKLKIDNVEFLWGINTSNFKPLEIDKEYDITFIGTPKEDRYEMIKYLIDSGVKVNIFGAGWEIYPDMRKFWKGRINNSDYIKVINKSKINLSFSKNYAGKPHYKIRTLEVLACKSFLLTEYFKGNLAFFKKGKEIIMFENKEDLLNKVKYYLKNSYKREKVAHASYKKVISILNIEKNLEAFFKNIEKNNSNLSFEFQPLTDKTIGLDIKELKNDFSSIEEKLRNYQYIYFTQPGLFNSDYRLYFQILALKRFKTNICCCDYYFWDNYLGDFMSFNTKHVLDNKIYKLKDVINLSQLMMTKDHFLKVFKEYKNNKESILQLIKKQDISFISIPLIRIPPKCEVIKKNLFNSYNLNFFYENIKPMIYKKDPKIILYIIKLIYIDFKYNKRLISNYLIGKIIDKVRKLR